MNDEKIALKRQRIVSFTLSEIIIDYEGISQSLNKACSRDETQYIITGLCQLGEVVLFVLEEEVTIKRTWYILAPFSGTSSGEIKADIFSRWGSEFTTKGLINLGKSYLGLFEKMCQN